MTDRILFLKGAAIAMSLGACAAPAAETRPADASVAAAGESAPRTEAASDPDPASLAGTRWVLIEAGGTRVPPRPPVTLNFEAGRFGGHSGCNGYGGEYRIEGRRIVVGLVSSTLVGCSGPVGDVEQLLFRAIGGAFEVAHRRGHSLTILREGRPALLFAPAP